MILTIIGSSTAAERRGCVDLDGVLMATRRHSDRFVFIYADDHPEIVFRLNLNSP